MPLYEYECKLCHKHTEKIQKFSDAEITTCPHCGGPLERVISAPAISFKGGGWFKDGYGNAKPAGSSSESKGESGTTSNSSSDSSTPAKSDGASESKPTASAPAAASLPAAPAPDKK
ncbi:MAG: zinc ribbon domain-containing protein [Acidobacteriaceae bacterium]|jgi:putative FmdB family regulatory protein